MSDRVCPDCGRVIGPLDWPRPHVHEYRCSCGSMGSDPQRSPEGASCPHVAALREVYARGWLKHTNGCSWEVRKDDGTKECDCGLLPALRAALDGEQNARGGA